MLTNLLTRRSALALLGAGLASGCSDMTLPALTSSKKTDTGPGAAPNARVTAAGRFHGKSDHKTSGGVRVVWSDRKWMIELEDDFSHDGAPDPHVALGHDGYRKEAVLGPLRALTGRQTYALPVGLNIGDYNEVWIWCGNFNVPLGVAPLTLT